LNGLQDGQPDLDKVTDDRINDIEWTWTRWKGSHTSNFLFNSLDDLVENVCKGIEELNATITKH
jgi:hypothetical protein